MAARSCEDCAKWWYDDKPAEGLFQNKIVSRGDVQFERPIDQKTKQRTKPPCEHCPKKSPEDARKMVLSTKNLQAYRFYRQSRAINHADITPEMAEDEIMRRNMEIIDTAVRTAERAAAGIGMVSLGGFAGGGGK